MPKLENSHPRNKKRTGIDHVNPGMKGFGSRVLLYHTGLSSRYGLSMGITTKVPEFFYII